MNLLAPINLLWLLPVAGAIFVLYMLRLKRRDVTVPSTMLWEQVLQDTHANAPFQKLRRSLLLVLQILAACALAFALSRPFLWASGLGGRSTVLVLDASASMRDKDEAGERFAAAVRRARDLVAHKGRGDAVAIVLAADRPVLLAPLTTDSARLEHALEQARATDTTGDIREAITYAGTLVQSRGDAQVTVLTDGAFGRVEPFALGGARLDFLPFGKRADNLAITAFDVRDTFGGGAGRQAFVTVQNFGAQTRRFPLNLLVNNKLVDAHEVNLNAGESHSEVFDGFRSADSGGLVQARIDAPDDLASDNTAGLTLPARQTRKLLLVSDGNPFLERALSADAQVVLDEVPPAKYNPADSANHDATIWDAAAPPTTLPPGRYLFWGAHSLGASVSPVIATTGGDANGMADQPQILDWSRTHPLMRFVDLANVKLLRARVIAPAPWAQTLAESSSGPLIVAGERNDLRSVYVGFDLLDSDMPLRVAFPIFLTNTLQWLTAHPGDTNGVLHPGETITLSATPSAGAITVTRPDGTVDHLPSSAPGSPAPFYRQTFDAGVYEAKGTNYTQTWEVSLLSAAESNVAPVAHPLVEVTDLPAPGTNTKGTVRRGVAVRREVWPLLAALALIALCVEWWVYHRRAG